MIFLLALNSESIQLEDLYQKAGRRSA
jgi:hypothetical protein